MIRQEESRSISENVTWGQRKRFADGKVSLPYSRFLGYDRSEDGLPQINEEEAKIVRLIYRLFLEGQTPHSIAKYLTEQGLTSPGGKEKWQSGTIRNILTNEKYKGDALLQKKYTVDFLTKKQKVNEGEVPQYYVENSHPAIISSDVFDIVQEEMKRRKTMKNRHSSAGMFSSKIICGECGGLYGSKIWHSTSKYRRVIFQCNNKFKGVDKCKTPHITEDSIKKLFVTAVNKLISNKDEVFENFEVIKHTIFDVTALETEHSEMKDEMSVVARLIQKCVSENAQAKLDQREYKQRYEGLVSRFEVAKARFNEISEHQQKIKVRRERVEAFLCTLKEQDALVTEFDEEIGIEFICSKVEITDVIEGSVFPYIDRAIIIYITTSIEHRKFYVAYDSDNDSEILKKLKDMVENIYTNWFISELSYAWSKSIDNTDFDEVQIQSVKKQRCFYDQMIRHKINSGDRIFVIVSDALRYEVAAEIVERLNTETIGSAEISSMIGVLPSVSKFGMAALLPSTSIELKDNGFVYVDGMNSGSMEGRNKILNSYVKESIAIESKKILKMKKQEIADLFTEKGVKLAYIYHNCIDAFGDKAATEIYTFKGAEEAIDDIIGIITLIRKELKATNIYVTADHGFIYQRDALEESDKIEKEKIDFIESGRRYALSEKKQMIDGLLTFSMKPLLGKGSNITAYIPRANIRFKIQGAGSNFVHGGASLQEIAVPLISYKNMKSWQVGSKRPEKVEVKLTNAIRKITNSIFTLNFFQTEKVEGKRVEASFKVYMADEFDQMISNEETIIANKTTDSPESRNSSIKFALKSMDYDKNKDYYLMVKDADTGVTKEKIPFKISLGIVSDFDF